MTYRDVVLADNPSHYWEINAGGQVFAQDLGSSPIPLGQISAVSTLGFSGPWDGGMAVLSTPTQYSTSDGPLAQAAPFSAECWVWLEKATGVAMAVFCGDGVVANSWGITVDVAQKPRVVAGGLVVLGATPMTRYTWHHLAFTYTGGVLTGYLDGVSFGAAPGGAALPTPEIYYLNAVGGGTLGLQGLSASPASYAYAVIAAQWIAHFAAGNDRSVFPIWLGSAGVSVVGGFPTTPLELSAEILASVRKTY